MPWSDSEAVEYYYFRLSTHLDYRHATDLDQQGHDELLARAVNFAHDHPTSVLSANDDGESLLELGIRYASLESP